MLKKIMVMFLNRFINIFLVFFVISCNKTTKNNSIKRDSDLDNLVCLLEEIYNNKDTSDGIKSIHIDYVDKKVFSISLSHFGMNKFPMGILKFKSLNSLDLQYNKIISVPDLSKLNNLKEITFSNNKIISIPDLSNSSITYLDVSHTKISYIDFDSLPPSIEELEIGFDTLKFIRVTNLKKYNKLKKIFMGGIVIDTLDLMKLNFPNIEEINLINANFKAIIGLDKFSKKKLTIGNYDYRMIDKSK